MRELHEISEGSKQNPVFFVSTSGKDLCAASDHDALKLAQGSLSGFVTPPPHSPANLHGGTNRSQAFTSKMSSPTDSAFSTPERSVHCKGTVLQGTSDISANTPLPTAICRWSPSRSVDLTPYSNFGSISFNSSSRKTSSNDVGCVSPGGLESPVELESPDAVKSKRPGSETFDFHAPQLRRILDIVASLDGRHGDSCTVPESASPPVTSLGSGPHFDASTIWPESPMGRTVIQSESCSKPVSPTASVADSAPSSPVRADIVIHVEQDADGISDTSELTRSLGSPIPQSKLEGDVEEGEIGCSSTDATAEPRPVVIRASVPAPEVDTGVAESRIVLPRTNSDLEKGNDIISDTSELTSSLGSPIRRSEPEGDVEEGRIPSARADVAGDLTTIALGTTVPVAELLAQAAESRIILPCAPSDEEKALYHRTGRWLVLSAGVLSYIALSVGMWLFIFTSPYFWWFAVPTVYLNVYLAAQYFGVGVWGDDFDPEEHKTVIEKAAAEGYQPTVDIFLPICNEPLCILANTWNHVAALDYPHVSVHVLDDGASDDVQNLAARYGFNYIRRPNRPELKKAGNLRYAFSRTSGDAIAILDADFCPRADFLSETCPYLLNPKIGILQTPQFFRWREEQTWVEQGAGVTQEFFYRLVQVNQDNFNGSCCAGSCALYRRAALEPIGGMAPMAHSEDMYTGFKMPELGYKLKYLPLPMAMGTCPDEPRSFFMQQYRWCMGTATLVTRRDFWKSSASNMQKMCVFNGMLYYIASALLIFLAPIPMMLLIWLSADGVLWIHSAFVLPAIIFAGIVIPMWSKQPYGMSSHRVKIIQCYAHMYALMDHFMGTAATWVPSGGGASRSSSKAYRSSVILLIVWNTLITVLIVGGAIWRMTTLTWYHFIPSMVLALVSFFLNISTLR